MTRSALSPHDDRPDETITVEVVVTLEDQASFAEHLAHDPELAHFRRIFWFVAALFLPPLVLALGVGVAWLIAPDDFAERLRGSVAALTAVWAGLVAALLLFAWIEHARRRRRQRWQAALVLRERAGIDPADPQLREAARCTFGPAGFRSQTTAGDVRVPWLAVTGLAEEADVLLVKTGRFAGFVLPCRDLGAEQIATIRRIVARYVGG